MNIILIGFKNAGKTTIGKQLAEQLQCAFVDTDDLLKDIYNHVNNCTLSISEIYKREKYEGFRAWEKNVVENLTEVDQAIIATGGGSILLEENVQIFKNIGKLVYLRANEKTLLVRQEQNPLPAFLRKEYAVSDFMKIYIERAPLYNKAADYVIDIDNKSDVDIILEILNLL